MTIMLVPRFGKNLKWHREQAGLSQGELAHLAWIHPTEISLLERGGREPRLETLVKLADSLEVDLGELSADISWKPNLPDGEQPGCFEITPPQPDLDA
jgi:transcriptional regulator with XRE-family HTH domain